MPENTVRKLHEEPVTKVVASAVNIIVGLTNDRQMTFQTGFEGDETDEAVNERFDRIMRLADRQKAKYEIPEVEDELFKHRETLANFMEDKERVEASHIHDQAMRQETLDEMSRLREPELQKVKAEINATILQIQERKAAEIEAGQEEWRRTGKLAGYKPQGARKRNIELCDKALEEAEKHREQAVSLFSDDYDAKMAKVQAEYNKAENERSQTLANLGISIARYEDAIKEREAKLSKLRATAGA